MAPETRGQEGVATENLLRLLEILRYEDMPITVLEAAGEAWVAATEIGRALGLHDNTIRQVVRKNPDIFDGLATTLEAIWVEGTNTSRVDQVNTSSSFTARSQEQAGTLFLNYSGVLAVLLKLDVTRIKDPTTRAKVVRFFRWALKDLKAVMLGRALPAGAGAAPPSLLPQKYLPAYRAFLCHVKDMPTPLLVQAAAAFGITLDPTAVEAERAAMVQPKRGALALAPFIHRADGAAPNKDAEAASLLEALRSIVNKNRGRIAGLESVGRGGRPEVPHQGYIGGVGKAYGVEVIGILPLALKDLMVRALGQYNARTFVQAMVDLGVLVPDLKYPGKVANLRYQRADGQTISLRHHCFRRDVVLANERADAAATDEVDVL